MYRHSTAQVYRHSPSESMYMCTCMYRYCTAQVEVCTNVYTGTQPKCVCIQPSGGTCMYIHCMYSPSGGMDVVQPKWRYVHVHSPSGGIYMYIHMYVDSPSGGGTICTCMLHSPIAQVEVRMLHRPSEVGRWICGSTHRAKAPLFDWQNLQSVTHIAIVMALSAHTPCTLHRHQCWPGCSLGFQVWGGWLSCLDQVSTMVCIELYVSSTLPRPFRGV